MTGTRGDFRRRVLATLVGVGALACLVGIGVAIAQDSTLFGVAGGVFAWGCLVLGMAIGGSLSSPRRLPSTTSSHA